MSKRSARRAYVVSLLLAAMLALWSAAVPAVSPEIVHALAFGDGDAKDQALAALVDAGDVDAIPLLQAFLDGNVKTAGEDRVLLVTDGKAIDAASGETVQPLPANLDDVIANNRIRRAVGTVIAVLKLHSPDRSARAAAAKELAGSADEDMLPAITAALSKEGDPGNQGVADADAGVDPARQQRQGHATRRDPRAFAKRRRGDPDTSARRARAQGQRRTSSRTPKSAREAQRSLSSVERRLAIGRRRRARLHGHLAGLDPAARGTRARDHLRPDGRHQHGARRAHHDRRLRDLRRAESLSPAPSRARSISTSWSPFPPRSASAPPSACCSSAP